MGHEIPDMQMLELKRAAITTGVIAALTILTTNLMYVKQSFYFR